MTHPYDEPVRRMPSSDTTQNAAKGGLNRRLEDMALQLGLYLRLLVLVVPFVIGACSFADKHSEVAGMAGMSHRSSLAGASGMSGVSSMGDMAGHIATVNAAQCERMRQNMQKGQGAPPDMQEQMLHCEQLEREIQNPPARGPRVPAAR